VQKNVYRDNGVNGMTDYIASMRRLVGSIPLQQCGASVILINADGELLLQKRRDNECWGFHGGGIELNESAEEAAKRELLEETGLNATHLELFGVFSGPELHYIYPNGDEVSNIDIVYLCRDYSGVMKAQSNEVIELRFFPLEGIPENISPPQRTVIRKYAESMASFPLLPASFSTQETLNTLTAIFERHKHERVCVIGTVCAGKTTLLKQLTDCIYMDDVLWTKVSPEDTAYLSQRPWTAEQGEPLDRLINEHVRVTPGFPLFGTVILECEAVVYLDISDELLAKHCSSRGEEFYLSDAKRIKQTIEEDWREHKSQGGKVFYYLTITE
jgi:8-oxo-dGTP pyrophosphatase MutT (NUDIX family)